MTKRKAKVLQARKSDTSRDDSLLTRSAESLGRVIGSLQRQVQDGTKRMSTMADEARKSLPDLPQLGDVFGGRHKPTRRKPSPARKKQAAAGAARTRGARKTGARKAGSAKKAARRPR